jgi:hypothetical protein
VKPLFVALLVMAGGATGAPQPPCASAFAPAYPPPGAPPVVKVWHADDIKPSGWEPPQCTGWGSLVHPKLVLVMAGSFRFDGTADELVDRIGAISTLRYVRYWSATKKTWRPLVLDASALSRLDPRTRRSDFLAAEMSPGTDLYYWVKHNWSGNIIYRMHVLERKPTRAVVATENLSPYRFLLMTLFEPGALQSIAIVELVSPGVWGISILTRAGESPSPLVLGHLATGHEASYINSAAAIYRHLAGIPTDAEPPAAP